MGVIAVLSYLIFALAFIGIYLFVNKKLHLSGKSEPHSIYWILLIGLIVRIILAVSIEGFSSDVGLFAFWSQNAAEDLFHIYQGDFFLDYPPFYMYVLFLIGKAAQFLGLMGGEPLYLLLLKLPSIIADLITAYLLYRLAKSKLPGNWPVIAAIFYVFNPAVFINSAVWGQVDSFLVMFLAFGFLLLNSSKPELSGFPLAAAILIKPQGLIFIPVVFYELIVGKDWKVFLKTLVTGLLSFIIIILPFALNHEPSWIIKLYIGTAEGYQYASLNAFNFFSLVGANLTPDSETFLLFNYQIWGYFFIIAMLVYSVILHWKGRGVQLTYMNALVLSMGVFMLSIRMHERYMFPVLFFLAVIFILTRDKRSLLFYGIASFTVFMNTFVVLDRMVKDNYPHVPPDDPVLLLISLINVLLFIAVLIWSWRSVVDKKIDPLNLEDCSISNQEDGLEYSSHKMKQLKEEEDYTLKISKRDIGIMAIMTIVYLVIAFINLGSFDVPQTQWAGQNAQDGFLIDLPSQIPVSRITFYSGLGEGSYNVWYLDENGEYQYLDNLVIDDFYKWHALEVSQTTSCIKFFTDQPGGMIKEIGVFSQGSYKPLPIEIKDLDDTPAQGELLHLSDEQHLVQYRQGDFMTSTYFDEIYHARTAYEHLNRISPYEWTHPPLGKILISIGISLFGMNTFGWRIIGTLTGAAMIPLMYLFGKKLFRKSFYGFCSAFLMMFDLMHFAQTRIATIDSYTTLFVILMFYFMADYYLHKSYHKGFYRSLIPLFLSGLFFGLGAATKWSAIYGAAGLALLFFMAKYNEYQDYLILSQSTGGSNKSLPAWLEKFIPVYMGKTILYCVLFFIIIPAAIYLLSYIPYLMVPGMEFSDIFEYQKSMYYYHSRLEATHGFQSEWWTWPLMIIPMWFYQGQDLPAGMASTIASFGNPAVWWTAIPAFLAAVGAAFKRNKAMTVVVIAVISQYIPWMMISRSAFIYHFFPMVPFMILAVVYLIKVLVEEKGVSKKLIYGYLGLVLILFILFYPAVSGLIVPESYISFLRWLPTWIF